MLISIIWVVLVIVVAVGAAVDKYNDPNGPWITDRLSDKSKEIYKNLEKDEKGPAYMVDLTYKDGTTTSIYLPLLDEPTEENNCNEQLEKIVKKIAKEDGKKISNNEIDQFINKVYKKNHDAVLAKAEYDAEIEKIKRDNIEEIKKITLISSAAAIIPPVVILLLGYGVAWVIDGFKTNP